MGIKGLVCTSLVVLVFLAFWTTQVEAKRAATNSLYVGGNYLWTSDHVPTGTVVGGVAQWKLGNSTDGALTRFVLELLGGGVHQRPGPLKQLVSIPNPNDPSVDDLFISGDFHRINNQISLGVAKYDGNEKKMYGLQGGFWCISGHKTAVTHLLNYQAAPSESNYLLAAGSFHYQMAGGSDAVNNIMRWDPRANTWTSLPLSANQNENNIPCLISITNPSKYLCTINAIATNTATGLICVSAFEISTTRLLCYFPDVLSPFESSSTADVEPSPIPSALASPSPTPSATKPKKSFRDDVPVQNNWVGGIWNALIFGPYDRIISDTVIIRNNDKEYVYAITAGKKKSSAQASVNLQRWSALSLGTTYETKVMWNYFCDLNGAYNSLSLMMPLITNFQNGVLVAYASSNQNTTNVMGQCVGDLSFYYQSDKDSLTGKKTDNPTLPPTIPVSKITSPPKQFFFQNNVLFLSDRSSVFFWDSKRSKTWQQMLFPAPFDKQAQIGHISWSDTSKRILVSACIQPSGSPNIILTNEDLTSCRVFTWDPTAPTASATLYFDEKDLGLRSFGTVNEIFTIPSDLSDPTSDPAAVFVGGDFSEGGMDSSVSSPLIYTTNNGGLWTGSQWVDLGISNEFKFLSVDSMIFSDPDQPSSRRIELYAIVRNTNLPFMSGDPLPFYYASILESQLQPDTIQNLGETIVWQQIPGVWRLSVDTKQEFLGLFSFQDIYCDEVSHVVYFGGDYMALSPDGKTKAVGLMAFDAISRTWSAIDTPLTAVNALGPYRGSGSSDYLHIAGYDAVYARAAYTLDISKNYSIADVNQSNASFPYNSVVTSLTHSASDTFLLGSLTPTNAKVTKGVMKYDFNNTVETSDIGAPMSELNEGAYSLHHDQLFVGSSFSNEWPYCVTQIHHPSSASPSWEIPGSSTIQIWSGSVSSLSSSLSIDNGPYAFLSFDSLQPVVVPTLVPGPPGPAPNNNNNGGLSTGEIIGLSIAIIVTLGFVITLVVAGVIVYKKRQEEDEVEFI